MKPDKAFVVRPMTLGEQKSIARMARAGLDNFDLMEKLEMALVKVSNWTMEDFDGLTTPEFNEILEAVKKANQGVAEALVPLSSENGSGPGESVVAEPSQVG